MKLTEIFQQYQIPYKLPGQHHHATGERIQTDCPFCNKVGKYRFGWGRRKVNCWAGCGEFTLAIALAKLLKISKSQAYKLLGNFQQEEIQTIRTERAEICVEPDFLPKLSSAHKDYLYKRNYKDIEYLEETYKIKATGNTDKPEHRYGIWIPYYLDNKLVTWTIRYINSNPRRFYNNPEQDSVVSIKDLLYGVYLYKYKSIVVIESAMDSWFIGAGCFASAGTAWTKKQANQIAKFPNRYIIFDPDDAGRAGAKKLANYLAPFDGNTFVVEIDQDLGKLDADLLKQVQDLIE